MKILEAIDILGINDVPVKPYTAGYAPKDMLTIYSDKAGIHFWDEATIWFVSIDDNNKNNNYKIKENLKRKFVHLNNNAHELEKYLAIFELLYAIANYKGENIEYVWESLESSVKKINDCIEMSLDFSEIGNMNNLIEVVKNDILYKQLFFIVRGANCRKENEYRGYKKNTVNYCFGNKKYGTVNVLSQIHKSHPWKNQSRIVSASHP